MNIHINIPEDAKKIIARLNKNGYEAYVVGGCVRDSILGRVPEDWDITTSARPMEIKSLFGKTIDTGIRHGTVTIRMGGCSYETTTFRIDGIYEDNRHPKQVEFTPVLSEDLKRRDFTINAMAYNPETGLVDMFGGINDLNNKIVRCVGNAYERFEEDALRTLRAVRFAGQLGFTIEEKTFNAMKTAAENIRNISVERIRVEITKLIISQGADRMITAYEAGLTKEFLPEWDRIVSEGRAERTIGRINYINEKIINGYEADAREHKILCFAALMLDMPDVHHILRRMKFDNYSIDKISRIVKFHDVSFDTDRYHMKKIINMAGPDVMDALYIIKDAEKAGAVNDDSKILYDDIIQKNEPIYIKDLKISGNDLIQRGIPAGKDIGNILAELLDEVLAFPEKNTEEYLADRALELYAGKKI